MTTQPPAPDWYPNPSGKPGLMYWDGQQWHTHIPDTSSPAERAPAEPIATTPRPHRRTALIAMLVVAVAVLAGMVGITSYLLQRHSPASQTPTAQPASPPGQPALPSSGMVPPANVPNAKVPGLAPFVGSWRAHEEGLTIQPDGHGRETYEDRSTCPDAPMAGCGVTGTVDFMLTRVSGDTAAGTITASSNPKSPRGGPVSVKLVGGGQGLELTIAGGDQGFEFCKANATTHFYCGA